MSAKENCKQSVDPVPERSVTCAAANKTGRSGDLKSMEIQNWEFALLSFGPYFLIRFRFPFLEL